ncbi:MAG: hypothetical protein K0S31_3520 [Sphingobacterium multivorum]|jgi:hypothetical protein|nr:hypothetical protein [Sphingobacterium multivorum]
MPVNSTIYLLISGTKKNVAVKIITTTFLPALFSISLFLPPRSA